MRASRLIVIEDAFQDVRSFHRRHEELQRELARTGGSLPPIEAWTPREALALIRGDGSRDTAKRRQWDGAECVLIDCWDRDAIDGTGNSFRSTFFALDVLAALREGREAAEQESRRSEKEVKFPRVVAYSRAMGDEMVRAALGEFLRPRVKVRLDDGSRGIGFGWRVDVSPGVAEEGVLWAMFDRDVLLDRLRQVAFGDRSGSLAPPPPTSTVWDEFLPNSCLASFHNELRDAYPDVWSERVLGATGDGLRASARKGILRIGIRYLEPNPTRGAPGYQGYIQIARRLADPR